MGDNNEDDDDDDGGGGGGDDDNENNCTPTKRYRLRLNLVLDSEAASLRSRDYFY